jgi:hypothetical protein
MGCVVFQYPRAGDAIVERAALFRIGEQHDEARGEYEHIDEADDTILAQFEGDARNVEIAECQMPQRSRPWRYATTVPVPNVQTHEELAWSAAPHNHGHDFISRRPANTHCTRGEGFIPIQEEKLLTKGTKYGLGYPEDDEQVDDKSQESLAQRRGD